MTPPGPPSRPTRQIAPTTKLTDANNTARPELSSQRKAVQAFHTRRAQELESTSKSSKSAANSGQDPSSSVIAAGSESTLPSTSLASLKRSINIDAIAGSVEPHEDENIDDHPRPRIF